LSRRAGRGAEDALGVAADLAGEDDLHVVRAADVQVVGDQCLEEAAGMAGCVEDDGAGDLHLPHRGLPPVAGVMVPGGERQWQPVQPPLGEHVDGARSEPVTDRLQRGGVLAGGEPVGQRGEPEPGLLGLPLGPLMPVNPDLGRIREPGAHLDERRAEMPRSAFRAVCRPGGYAARGW
jgi:hypothetical protein